MSAVPAGGWLAAEEGKAHFDADGWCRCCCDDCHPHGCSHRSNPAACKAHPLDASVVS